MARRPRQLRYTALEGKWYRIVRSGRDPLDSSRTRYAGGRYNPPRSFPVLYLGDQPATCLIEVLAHSSQLPPTYDLVTIELRLQRVVDLFSEAGRKLSRVSLEDLVALPVPVLGERQAVIGTRYAATWELGRLAWARGADGLLVPSAVLPVQKVLVAFGRVTALLKVLHRRPIPTDPRIRRRARP